MTGFYVNCYRCCCATAVDGSINPLNGIVIIIAIANKTATANRFLVGSRLRIIHQIYFYACAASIEMILFLDLRLDKLRQH
jgi:hypothetical protein